MIEFNDERTILYRLLREKGIRTGTFALETGETTNWIIDYPAVSLSAVGAQLLGKIFYDMIGELCGTMSLPDFVVGVGPGGATLATATSLHSVSNPSLQPQPMDALYIPDHDSNIPEGPRFKFSSAVVLMEEVAGISSAVRAAKVLEDNKINVFAIMSICDRRDHQKPGDADILKGYDFASIFTDDDLAV